MLTDSNANSDPHEAVNSRSYRNLDLARQLAHRKSAYDSHGTRSRIQNTFEDRFGHCAHDWQLDVAEALILGLDTVVIAGTGSGKTMPFMMPLLLEPSSKVIILLPLKVLQEDQASRFEKMKLTAVAVNGDSWSYSLQKGLKENHYQGILASPEMCLKHSDFRRTLTASEFKGI